VNILKHILTALEIQIHSGFPHNCSNGLIIVFSVKLIVVLKGTHCICSYNIPNEGKL
jgi:hypothetical protein